MANRNGTPSSDQCAGLAQAQAGRATVSVIVPHFSDLAALDVCLDGLQRQTYSMDLLEIIVADNNSPEGLAAVERTIAGRAKLVSVDDKGAGPTRNGGVAASTGDILAFIDCDCQPEPDWVAHGAHALETADFVGGRVDVLVNDPAKMTAEEAFERVFAFDFKTYVTRKGFAGSGNLFCRRSLFDAVGGFRTGVSEDVEWSHRARDLGFRIGYAPDAVVGHPARRTWADLSAKWRRLNSEMFQLTMRRPAGRWVWVARSLALPLSALAHTPRPLFSSRLDNFEQRALAVGTLYRLRLWRCMNALSLIWGPHDR